MAIIPSEPFELSPCNELIFTIAEMIDHAVTSKDAMSPFDMATTIVNEALTIAKIPLDELEDVAT